MQIFFTCLTNFFDSCWLSWRNCLLMWRNCLLRWRNCLLNCRLSWHNWWLSWLNHFNLFRPFFFIFGLLGAHDVAFLFNRLYHVRLSACIVLTNNFLRLWSGLLFDSFFIRLDWFLQLYWLFKILFYIRLFILPILNNFLSIYFVIVDLIFIRLTSGFISLVSVFLQNRVRE